MPDCVALPRRCSAAAVRALLGLGCLLSLGSPAVAQRLLLRDGATLERVEFTLYRETDSPESVSDSPGRNLRRNVGDLWPVGLGLRPVTCRQGAATQVVRTDLTGQASCLRQPGPQPLVISAEGRRWEVAAPQWPAARRLTVSDLDDTVVAWCPPGQAPVRNVLLGNALTRPVYPDAVARLRAEAAQGPVIYLSNSPQGLGPGLVRLLQRAGAPAADALLLRPWGLAGPQHKAGALRRLAAQAPQARFVLLGDTVSRDPEIYADFAAQSGRVDRIVIRNVSGPERWAEVTALLRRAGVPWEEWPAPDAGCTGLQAASAAFH